MSDDKLRQVRVLHLVSSNGLSMSMQQTLFMPLLTRMPKQKVKAQVVSLAPGFSSGTLLRQSGIPVYDIPLSRRRFAFGALGELLNIARQFRPDVIQAWGHTAQLASMYVRKRCDWKPKVVWSVADTSPIAKDAGLIDRRKLRMAVKRSAKADRIVYTSEAGAAQHRRCGYPDSGHAVIPAGIDPTRFKPDYEARRKVREQLGLTTDAFVVGMVAPFQPDYDHATLLKGVGELIKTHPNVSVILAGHGIQKGNAPLMALVGGGTLGTRTHLLGEWSDTAAFFAACDVACSSSLHDGARMTLVMAMLCGIPCVATGIGAQGEMLGRFGVAIEAGSAPAVVRGITRVMQMPEDRRIAMVQSARKYALGNFVSVLSMQKYLQLYYDVVGRQALADVPVPQVDASIPAPPADLRESSAKIERARAAAAALVSLHQVSDPDSLETQVPEVTGAYTAPTPAPVAAKEEKPVSDGDVLKIFESGGLESAKGSGEGNPMSERARGVAEDLGDLLAPEELQTAKIEALKLEAAKSEAAKPEVVKPAVETVKPVAEAPKPVAEAVKPVVEAAKPAATSSNITSFNPMSERARGVAEDVGDLLSPEELGTVRTKAVKPQAKSKPEAKSSKSESAKADAAAKVAALKAKLAAVQSAGSAARSSKTPASRPDAAIEASGPVKPAAKTAIPETQPGKLATLTPAAPQSPSGVAAEALKVVQAATPVEVVRPVVAPGAVTQAAVVPSSTPELKSVSVAPAVRHTPVQLPMLLDEDLFMPAPDSAVESTLQLRLLDDEQAPLAAAG